MASPPGSPRDWAPWGEFVFHIFSSLAQFERLLIQERTQAGLAAARARGRLGGRRPVRADDARVVTAKCLHQDRGLSINQICKTLGISRPTFYRYLALSDVAGPKGGLAVASKIDR